MRLDRDLNTRPSPRLPANQRWNNVNVEFMKDSKATRRVVESETGRGRFKRAKGGCFYCGERFTRSSNRIGLSCSRASAYLSGAVMHQLITTDAPSPLKRDRHVEVSLRAANYAKILAE